MIKRTGIAIAGLTMSREVFALATVSAVAVAVAPELSFNPWTWILGAFCGTLAQAFLPADKEKPEPTNRMTSFLSWIHGRKMHFAIILVSIILAGVVSEWIVRIFTDQKWTPPNLYAAAFLLSSTWPFAAHVMWKKALKWSDT